MSGHSQLKQRRSSINQDDPRVRRTLKLLGDTLLELIAEQGYENITIKDITDRAEVSRTTFYLHFKDKDELLFESMRVMYDELAQTARHADFSDLEAAEIALCDPADFEHVQKYLDFYRVMLSEQGSMSFLLRVQDYLAALMSEGIRESLPRSTQPNVPLPIIAYAAAGSEIGIMRWWIREGLPYTPEEMGRFLYDVQMKGIWWALGLETPDI